jgi:5-methylcytosine-specific restriction endonuclease McrA
VNTELPAPGSEELDKLVTHTKGRAIYRILYENQDNPLSIAQIREAMGLAVGEQEQLGRRLRDLRKLFVIHCDNKNLYTLKQKREVALNTSSISGSDRAWALRDQRCAQCGRTPTEDGVKLHVDHKMPQEWGGTNDRGNLQALCSECNEGKKNLYATYDEFADKIKASANYDEVHKRIGELLKAFDGKPVPSDLIDIVAKAKQYQDDWQKRMRELRELGWDYSVSKKREGNKVKSAFTLVHFEPWPEGSVRAAIRQRELQKKQTKESD